MTKIELLGSESILSALSMHIYIEMNRKIAN